MRILPADGSTTLCLTVLVTTPCGCGKPALSLRRPSRPTDKRLQVQPGRASLASCLSKARDVPRLYRVCCGIEMPTQKKNGTMSWAFVSMDMVSSCPCSRNPSALPLDGWQEPPFCSISRQSKVHRPPSLMRHLFGYRIAAGLTFQGHTHKFVQ